MTDKQTPNDRITLGGLILCIVSRVVGLIFLKILSLKVNIGVDTIGIRFCNWKILKKVVTNFSSGGHQVVWILVLVHVMFDCFQAWKLAQNQAWKQSNMACSTSAEEDFQARAAQLLLLHWSYSHQPVFLDEDTEQSTGAQMHCEDAIAKWFWYYCNTSSWLSQYNAFFWLSKNIESATRDVLCPVFDLCTELSTLAASSCLCGSQYILQRTSSCRRDNAKQNVSSNLNIRQCK